MIHESTLTKLTFDYLFTFFPVLLIAYSMWDMFHGRMMNVQHARNREKCMPSLGNDQPFNNPYHTATPFQQSNSSTLYLQEHSHPNNSREILFHRKISRYEVIYINFGIAISTFSLEYTCGNLLMDLTNKGILNISIKYYWLCMPIHLFFFIIIP